MPRRNRKKVAECAYCGNIRPVSRDHVPPEACFAKPRPRDLITVPCCEPCNASFSKDDDYFQLCLALSNDGRGHRDVDGRLHKVLRSLQKPEARGRTQALLRSTFEVELRTPMNLYAGNGMAFSVDLPRLFRTAERIVRGLHFHETGNRLPPHCGFVTYNKEVLECQSLNYQIEFERLLLAPLAAVAWSVIGDEAFAYRHRFAEGSTESAIWWMIFYGRIAFITTVSPEPRVWTS